LLFVQEFFILPIGRSVTNFPAVVLFIETLSWGIFLTDFSSLLVALLLSLCSRFLLDLFSVLLLFRLCNPLFSKGFGWGGFWVGGFFHSGDSCLPLESDVILGGEALGFRWLTLCPPPLIRKDLCYSRSIELLLGNFASSRGPARSSSLFETPPPSSFFSSLIVEMTSSIYTFFSPRLTSSLFELFLVGGLPEDFSPSLRLPSHRLSSGHQSCFLLLCIRFDFSFLLMSLLKNFLLTSPEQQVVTFSHSFFRLRRGGWDSFPFTFHYGLHAPSDCDDSLRLFRFPDHISSLEF